MPYSDPVKMAEYMRQYRKRKPDKVNVNRKPIDRKPVNPSVSLPKEKYLLSYSRNKYQYVLYSVDQSGRRSLIKSCKKNDKINLGPCEIELTWGPEEALK